MPFPFRKERGLKHWRVLDCSGLRKVESVFQQHGNTQRNQQVDGFLCRGAHLGTTERRSPVLCYSFVYISGHALCLMLCFSPTFLFSVTGCSVRSAIAAEILKKLQCRNLLNGKPQCGQKNPTKITIIWTSWLAYILFKPYKNETNWIFCFFFSLLRVYLHCSLPWLHHLCADYLLHWLCQQNIHSWNAQSNYVLPNAAPSCGQPAA